VVWTLDEALEQLHRCPRDPFLQYVALQLAWRAGNAATVQGPLVEAITGASPVRGRLASADLFSLFTGALAVQESLQLDAMSGPGGQRTPGGLLPEENRETVQVTSLIGPTIKSHPWDAMLAGRKPTISPLALCVPEDQYLVEFRSASKLLDLLDQGDLWATHLATHAGQAARSQRIRERFQHQLAIETSPLLRPFYDLAIDGVVFTGTDLSIGEGTDLTILLHARQPEVVKAQLDRFLNAALKSRPDVKSTSVRVFDIECTQLSTPDRAIHVFAARPRSDLFIRSNSRVALERVLAVITNQAGVKRLGDSTEFAFIRTIFPTGAPEEDGFIYLSDPFIRNLVGPVWKLTERRRMVCYNHIRMISHAALLYRMENGRLPKSLDELATAQCSPGPFNTGGLRCPDGGRYVLDPDGLTGHCSRHGHADALVPACEIPVTSVSSTEADQYAEFVKDYNQYWRTYFDPIALRIHITPQRYRMETIVLPLIDNSIYTGLARVLGGTPESLDALPVPKRNFFTLAFRLNKDQLLKDFDLAFAGARPSIASAREADAALAREVLARGPFGLPSDVFDKLNVKTVLQQGLGNQIAFHLYDSPPPIDVNVPMLGAWLLRQSTRSISGPPGMLIGELPAIMPIAGLLHPVYVSIPVQNRQIVDDFLTRLDQLLAAEGKVHRGDWLVDYASDFYKLNSAVKASDQFRVATLRFGPVKFRLFWARLGDGLYLATQPFILDDLIAAQSQPLRTPGEAGPLAHALFRIRASRWNEVLAADRLGWAESNREACLNNVGPLSSLLRALIPRPSREQQQHPVETVQALDQIMGTRPYCPEGGHYTWDGRSVTCSVHGSLGDSKQPEHPAEDSQVSRLLRALRQFSGSIMFQSDGLFATLEIERSSER
jgi:hypothetical protein